MFALGLWGDGKDTEKFLRQHLMWCRFSAEVNVCGKMRQRGNIRLQKPSRLKFSIIITVCFNDKLRRGLKIKKGYIQKHWKMTRSSSMQSATHVND